MLGEIILVTAGFLAGLETVEVDGLSVELVSSFVVESSVDALSL
ncbi:MAG: hypothetical protein R2685_06765 [Candidatus Nitrosocosmicus sp.]